MPKLLDIKNAKKIGKTISGLRKSHNLSVRALANLTNFSMQKIVHLENGNHFAFNEAQDEFTTSANHCLELLTSENHKTFIEEQTLLPNEIPVTPSIPAFLRRSI
jgi:transcriptional regulator with XRE-family HTH domain